MAAGPNPGKQKRKELRYSACIIHRILINIRAQNLAHNQALGDKNYRKNLEKPTKNR